MMSRSPGLCLGPAGWNLAASQHLDRLGSCGAAGGLGFGPRADTVEDLTAMLAEFGVERIAWHGWLFTGRWTLAQPGAGAEDLALEAGLQASRLPPSPHWDRLFHYQTCARRPDRGHGHCPQMKRFTRPPEGLTTRSGNALKLPGTAGSRGAERRPILL